MLIHESDRPGFKSVRWTTSFSSLLLCLRKYLQKGALLLWPAAGVWCLDLPIAKVPPTLDSAFLVPTLSSKRRSGQSNNDVYFPQPFLNHSVQDEQTRLKATLTRARHNDAAGSATDAGSKVILMLDVFCRRGNLSLGLSTSQVEENKSGRTLFKKVQIQRFHFFRKPILFVTMRYSSCQSLEELSSLAGTQ